MIVSIASGKGGTGKTTVAVSLALSLAGEDGQASGPELRPWLLDCDVEAPNAGLFFSSDLVEHRDVEQLIPRVDSSRCNFCGRCAEVCVFRALAVLKYRVLVFPELCHGCGSCSRICPRRAIEEVPRRVGILEHARNSRLEFVRGLLNVGEAMPVPAIRAVKRWVLEELVDDPARTPVILDAPPGTACPMVETVRGSDFALLVSEPTPFGLHDLQLALEVTRGELKIPTAVVVNRDGIGDDRLDRFCSQQAVPILMRIPDERRIAEGMSDGQPLVEVVPEYRERFRKLAQEVEERCRPDQEPGLVAGGVGR